MRSPKEELKKFVSLTVQYETVLTGLFNDLTAQRQALNEQGSRTQDLNGRLEEVSRVAMSLIDVLETVKSDVQTLNARLRTLEQKPSEEMMSLRSSIRRGNLVAVFAGALAIASVTIVVLAR